jgi:hypothetical protein
MRMLGTTMVCTVEVAAAVHVGACWDGGETISVFVDAGGLPRRTTALPIWNPIWDSPLIEPTRESFERFVLAWLDEPGVIDRLIDAARACG